MDIDNGLAQVARDKLLEMRDIIEEQQDQCKLEVATYNEHMEKLNHITQLRTELAKIRNKNQRLKERIKDIDEDIEISKQPPVLTKAEQEQESQARRTLKNFITDLYKNPCGHYHKHWPDVQRMLDEEYPGLFEEIS